MIEACSARMRNTRSADEVREEQSRETGRGYSPCSNRLLLGVAYNRSGAVFPTRGKGTGDNECLWYNDKEYRIMDCRKLTPIIAVALTLAICLAVGVATVFAVHDDGLFELDGNATNEGAPGDDWASIFQNTDTSLVDTGIIVDPVSNDTTHFKGGNKDTQDITEWSIVSQDDTPKDNIEHAFAAAYVRPSDSHLIIYAGDDRFAQSGTASHGFWFFKNQIGIAPSGDSFTGVHADGDTLVAVEFQQGGAVAFANIFQWVTNPAPGQPNLQSIFSGSTQVTPGVPFCNSASGIIPADVVCGITNSATTPSPWFYFSSSGNPGIDEDFPPQSFFELGIDITELTGQTCFASFLATSRSSASANATIKDFVLHSFPVCGVKVGKACFGTPIVVEGSKLESTFNVPITATGAGTIHNVHLAEVPPVPLGPGESCRITAIEEPVGADAAPLALPFTFIGTTPVEVYTSLAGTTATVTVKCITQDRNPFIDKVVVTAKSSPTSQTFDLSANHTTGLDEQGNPVPGEICPVVGDADVAALKCCKSVTIDPDTLQPEVCVAIQLTNNSVPAEDLENIKIVDDQLGTVTSGDTLAAGTSKTYSGCYTPTSADQTGNPVSADDISFTDKLTEVSGTGVASGDTFLLNTVPPLPSATCFLCGNQPPCTFTIP
jgi:hypothetical protein